MSARAGDMRRVGALCVGVSLLVGFSACTSGGGEQGAPPPRPPGFKLADRPEALLEEGAIKTLRAALERRGALEKGASPEGAGIDAAMSAALRQVQAEAGLAKTGLPDAATLRQLGLEPQALYRSVYLGPEQNKAEVPVLDPKQQGG